MDNLKSRLKTFIKTVGNLVVIIIVMAAVKVGMREIVSFVYTPHTKIKAVEAPKYANGTHITNKGQTLPSGQF